jgi:hypothetical protein
MIGAQTFPNLFIVAEGARILAAGLVTQEVLNFRFFPRLVRRFVRAVFESFTSVCAMTAENNREKCKQNLFSIASFPRKTGL